ncbi:MAG: ribonuclease Z, partial [Pyrinomonadaceae bacterium]|nr:ribonuclease Z [Pyrinomonadaceae bacterium]
MQTTFLGTSAGVPTCLRNVSSVALRLSQRGEWWMFDCGEATQHQILH